jgi:hypothetical protein
MTLRSAAFALARQPAIEPLSFPTGKQDSQVDALGLVGKLLDTISTGNWPEPVTLGPADSGYRSFDLTADRTNDWLVFSVQHSGTTPPLRALSIRMSGA